MAQLKNTNINDTGNFTLPAGTTAQRPASPAAGMIRYNTTINDTEYYDGAAWRPISDSNPEATGGTVVDTDIGGIPYRIHVFETTGNSTFTVTKGGEVEYLLVAGGGAGGGHNAGGGGAGGLLTGTTTVTAQSYTITVGAGGLAVNNALGNNGANSSALGLTAIGGGRGGTQSGAPSGGPSTGGSGGGGGGTQAGAAGTSGQGNAGGTGVGFSATGGGGGGAGSAGGAHIANKAGNGGHGIYSDILGIGYYWAGGGGGSIYGGPGYPLGDAGDGGLGGGGGGGHRAAGGGIAGVAGSHGYKSGKDGIRAGSDRGGDAGQNTGSGGGGSNGPTLAGNGGSGIVIIRYRRNASTATTPTRTMSSVQPNFYNISNRSGLVLELDANNIASYPGTGSTWNDISGLGNNFLINSSAFKTERGISYMDFNGSFGCAKYATGADLIISGNVTVICWTRILNSSSAWRTLIRGTSDSSGADHQVIIESGNWRIGMYDNTNGTGFNNSGADQRDLPGYGSNQWNMLVWRWNDAVTPYYNFYYNDTPDVLRGSNNSINSRFKHGFNSLGAYGNNTGTNVSASSQFWGDIASFYMYNRFISNDEVLNIFNATRSRYGI